MDLRLTDSAALVTASSSGLGRAAATALAREGANVAICARNAERLEDARAETNEAGSGDVLAVQTDITDPDEIDDLIAEVTADFGGLDHLVTSAGTPAVKPFGEAIERDWYSAFDLLVMSVVWLAGRARPFLVESDTGSLTAVASTDAREPVAGNVLSSVVRRAVPGLVGTLALEWAPEIRVNAVLPGPHATPGFEKQVRADVDREKYGSYGEALGNVTDGVPLGRVGDPDAFGDVVAVLASPRASFVTGACVPVDGGRLRR